MIKTNSSSIKHTFGLDIQSDLNILLEKCRELIPNYDEELIKLAFNYCVISHEGKLRKSGEKFYTHPLAVAFIVLEEIPLDDASVAAALLHNVTDESDIYTYEDIKFTFGTNIAQIVEGVSRIKFVESQHIDRTDQLDNYRKLLLSLFTDVRIILIKLADKLHNMRTLQYVSPESQKRRSTEALQIYAPFANRFGLRKIKFELEDLAFKYLNPKEYEHIENTIKGTHQERELYVEKFKQPVVKLLNEEGFLKKNNITYTISGRAKHIYSIYNKTLLRQKKVEDLYDIFAIRIILDTDNPLFCFYVYGIIANYYKPIPETFKDYISSPKENGYQSLHTAVAGPDEKIVEVQIRTLKMHQFAEDGLAAHFRYKSTPHTSIFEDSNLQSWFDEVREIFENIGTEDPKLYEIVTKNMLSDTIYVFTPKDEFRKLPKGSTALDFAFNIHSKIGFSAIGAKINGKLHGLDQILVSGDKVEIITSKKQKPNKSWLDFVITSRANTQLIKYFNNEEKEAIQKGQKIWERKNQEYGFSFTKEEMNAILTAFHFEDIKQFYKSLANETLDINKVHKFIMLQISEKLHPEINHIENKDNVFKNTKTKKKEKNKINDFDENKVILASCCSPVPNEQIFAITDEEGEIIVHSKNCLSYKQLMHTHTNKTYNITWEKLKDIAIKIKLKIIAYDTENLMHKIIATLITYNSLLIKSISQESNNSIVTIKVVFEINNDVIFTDLIKKIEEIDSINSVERII